MTPQDLPAWRIPDAIAGRLTNKLGLEPGRLIEITRRTIADEHARVNEAPETPAVIPYRMGKLDGLSLALHMLDWLQGQFVQRQPESEAPPATEAA